MVEYVGGMLRRGEIMREGVIHFMIFRYFMIFHETEVT
jgi:hypothetical protein